MGRARQCRHRGSCADGPPETARNAVIDHSQRVAIVHLAQVYHKPGKMKRMAVHRLLNRRRAIKL